MKYQLADLVSGAFGDVFDSLEAAELALAEAIQWVQAENDSHADEYAQAGLPVPQAAEFFSIVEVE